MTSGRLCLLGALGCGVCPTDQTRQTASTNLERLPVGSAWPELSDRSRRLFWIPKPSKLGAGAWLTGLVSLIK
ncbi:unnamed protein product, partial [Amoebophrya sp. A25]|eukprot:GSA25T00027764001.1